jgi:hypothetical protein
MFRRVGNSSGKGDEIPRVQHFFRNSLWRVNGGVNAGQWGRAKPSPVCAVIELEARVRPGGDGRGFVTGAGVVDFAGFGIGSCGGRSCSGLPQGEPRPRPVRPPPRPSGHGAPQSFAGLGFPGGRQIPCSGILSPCSGSNSALKFPARLRREFCKKTTQYHRFRRIPFA